MTYQEKLIHTEKNQENKKLKNVRKSRKIKNTFSSELGFYWLTYIQTEQVISCVCFVRSIHAEFISEISK